MATAIYIIFDPRDGAVRYVGASANTCERFAKHCRHKWPWHPLKPLFQIIEWAGDDWRQRERFWISNYIGLLNRPRGIGGGCPPGYRHTQEAKDRISMAGRGRKHPNHYFANGGRHTPETIEKMRAKHKGKIILTKQRAKISASLTGKHPTEQTRRKLRARGFSAEHRARLAVAARRQWADGRGWSQ
jgi:hypothetical protein